MYYTYMLRCADGSLYTGYTSDLCRRLKEHNGGTGSKYVCSRRPVELAYSEAFEDKALAMRREIAIKRLRRERKLELCGREYAFVPAFAEDVEGVFGIIERRVEWLKELGIDQWQNGYLSTYPMEYYREKQRAGELYVLRKQPTSSIVGCAVLYSADRRWDGQEDEPAYYVHNLASDIGEAGAGLFMLNAIEALSRRDGKRHVRLDCAVGNARLNEYYDALGYAPRGECVDGTYRGRLREKML